MHITDCFFVQGTSHVVCEDYATRNDDTVIVCDGCSSSPDTDFGARILARLSLSQISTYGDLDPALMARTVEQKILTIPSLSTNAADATMLSAKVLPNGNVSVHAFGDGVLVKISGETVTIYVLEHETGAPGYISYYAKDSRKEFYEAQSEGKFRTMSKYEFSKGVLKQMASDYDAFLEQLLANKLSANSYESSFSTPPPDTVTKHDNLGTLSFEFENPDAVLIFSDGVETFQKTLKFGNGEVETLVVPLPVVLSYLLKMKKVTSENYMTRRARRFLGREVDWKPKDDFTVASIWRKG